ncbi:hypothetical protein GL259_03210 [Streptomyces sp. Tu 3180]|nr:hypothetical protein GL259_03210 [Streptomyces sp. Tu 3180]
MRIAAGSGTPVGTAQVRIHVTAVVRLPAARAPDLLEVPRENDPDVVLLDGTLAECDRVGDSPADHSAEHRRHDVRLQLIP